MDNKLELVKGKRCVVVAPSGYLKGRGSKSGEFIESFDSVIKCTNSCEIDDPNNELGARCDIWYGLPYYPAIAWSVSFAALKKQSVKLLSFQPRLERYGDKWDTSVNWFLEKNKQHQHNWVEANREHYQKLLTELSCIPFTGVFAVIDLLNQGAKEVYAYGHDFYQTGYFDDRASSRFEGSEWHKLEPQMAMFWKLLQTEPRFNCDDNLKQILYAMFGEENKVLDQVRRLFLTDLSHFFDKKQQSMLVFRTCNIQKFTPFLSVIESYFADDSVDVLCQSSFVEQLAGSKSHIINYGSDQAIKFEVAMAAPELRQKKYLSCLIPYNGLEMLTYYDVLLIVKSLDIANIFIVSPRGGLFKIDDINKVCLQIEKYLSVRAEYKMLNDKFDRKNCL
ncbi:MAG: hypothetical protein ACJASL_001239 [Paraglaciecola sp.]